MAGTFVSIAKLIFLFGTIGGADVAPPLAGTGVDVGCDGVDGTDGFANAAADEN